MTTVSYHYQFPKLIFLVRGLFKYPHMALGNHLIIQPNNKENRYLNLLNTIFRIPEVRLNMLPNHLELWEVVVDQLTQTCERILKDQSDNV